MRSSTPERSRYPYLGVGPLPDRGVTLHGAADGDLLLLPEIDLVPPDSPSGAALPVFSMQVLGTRYASLSFRSERLACRPEILERPDLREGPSPGHGPEC